MRLLKNLPIGRKITLIVLFSSGVGLSVALAALFAFQILTFRQNYARDLAALGQIIAENSTAAITFNDRGAADDILAALHAKPHIIFSTIHLPDGSLFARFDSPGAPSSLETPPKPTGNGLTDRHLIYAEPIILDQEEIGSLYLVSDQRKVLSRMLKLDLLILGGVLIISISLTVVFSSRMQKVISEPIQKLSDTAILIASKRDYSMRAEKMEDDEIGLYTDAFNQMLERIEEQDHAIRRSEIQYRSFFEGCPISLWEEDFSEVKSHIDELKRSGVRDFEGYFRAHPEAVDFCASKVKIVDVNEATLELHQAENKEALFQGLSRLLSKDSSRAFCEELIAFANGEVAYQGEFVGLTLDGREFHTLTSLSIPPGYEDTWSKVFISVIDITARKNAEQELQDLHKKLLEASHQAGMAAVATGVLHNVGNVLNSVNVTATLITEVIRKSRIQILPRISALLKEHEEDMATFLTAHPKGQLLPGYINDLSEHVLREREELVDELDSLRKNIEHIKDIVAMQQNYARVSGLSERQEIVELIEDAYSINAAGFTRHSVNVFRDFEKVPPVLVDKHKVLQILVNLLHNGKYAVSERAPGDRRIDIGVSMNGNGRVRVTVRDNGIGITPEDSDQIFSHGFTTRAEGHGFGLHSGANAAREMNGSLCAYSEGKGCGATFTLELPIAD